MKSINVYSDGVVTGFAPGDIITHNTTLGGSGTWTVDSATGDITFNPDDECVSSFGLFEIESDCCKEGFSVTYNGDCIECDPALYAVVSPQEIVPDPTNKGVPVSVDNLGQTGTGSSWDKSTVAMAIVSNDGDGTLALNAPSNGEFTYTPAETDGIVEIVISYTAADGCTANVTTTINCRCQTWQCPDADPDSIEFLCDLGHPLINASYNDNLFNGGSTPGEQRLQQILDLIASPTEMELGDDCEFLLTRTDNDGNRIEVTWIWERPGPTARIEIFDDSGNETETFEFEGTCTALLEVDRSYSLDLVSSTSTTGSINTSEAVRLIVNPNAPQQGAC